MRPLLHPTLLNGRTGDPALYVEMLFEKRAIMFDLGDIAALSTRRICGSITCSSRTRMSITFSASIGCCGCSSAATSRSTSTGRTASSTTSTTSSRPISGTWSAATAFRDLIFVVTEVDASLAIRTARFRLKTAFAAEPVGEGRAEQGIIVRDPAFQVSTAVLAHRTPCLGFAVEEPAHLNVWKTRLAERGLPVGPWLHDLKRAVIENRPDDFPVRMRPATANVGRAPTCRSASCVTS